MIDSEAYALTCYRYIELNPVRADMVTHPSEYPWSSYRQNALGQPDKLVAPHDLYQRLGKTDNQRQKAYRSLFRTRIPNTTLAEIRAATNKAWVLGSDRFKERMATKLSRPVKPSLRGGDRKSKAYHENSIINRDRPY